LGLHVQKCVVFTRFHNISHQRNIACIQHHLSKKDKAITKKKLVLHNSLLTSKCLQRFMTSIISNVYCPRFFTLLYYNQIIMHDFASSSTWFQKLVIFSSQSKHQFHYHQQKLGNRNNKGFSKIFVIFILWNVNLKFKSKY
jgi:uncharacterized membrane protein